jgi:uncharacterized protein (UPF0548 family)
MLRVRAPSPEILRRVLEEQGWKPFTYADVGATAGVPPAGFRSDTFETDLGADDDDRFQAARRGVLAWAPQRGAGITVYPDAPPAADHAFVLVLPFPVIGCAVAPARVVYVLDEPARAGFAYGTLPGHPERGEEAFIVVREGGRLVFRVGAFSRPGDLLARLGGPVARMVQVRTIRTYLRAMEQVTGAAPGE